MSWVHHMTNRPCPECEREDMRIGNPTTAMIIVLLYKPEMRFTAAGRALCVMEAEGIIGMRFEAWEEIAEAIAQEEMNAGDAIEVKGDAWVRGWQDKDGEHHQTQVFTVREWQRVPNYTPGGIND